MICSIERLCLSVRRFDASAQGLHRDGLELLFRPLRRSEEAEEDRQKDEAVVEREHHDQEVNLESDGVGGGGACLVKA